MFPFQIGVSYNFATRAPSVLGAYVKNHMVKGIIDYDTACKYINVDSMQRVVYPLLPPGTPNIPKAYSYILLRSKDNATTVLAYPWIDENTIEAVTSTIITVTVPSTNTDDVNRIRGALNLMGYTGYTIDVETS